MILPPVILRKNGTQLNLGERYFLIPQNASRERVSFDIGMLAIQAKEGVNETMIKQSPLSFFMKMIYCIDETPQELLN